LSSRELQFARRSHGGICLETDTVREVWTGRCGGDYDGGVCTGHADACLEPSQFVRVDRACQLSITDDIDPSASVAVYGRCHDTCYWSNNDCTGEEQWYGASESPSCTCENVKVGACRYDNRYFCAVDIEACDADSTFLSVCSLEKVDGAPDCRLCRSEGYPSNAKPSTMGSPNSNSDTEGSPQAGSLIPSPASDVKDNGTGEVARIVVAASWVFY
jgi:hypothetical protein